MNDFNIAAKSQEDRDKVSVDLAASGVAYKERLNMPVVAEVVARESSLNTCASISWSASATIANRAFNSPAHPIRATSKWPARTRKNSLCSFCNLEFSPS